MSMPGCYCWGSNTPELDEYCACRGIGDRDSYHECLAIMEPDTEAGNRAYATGDYNEAMNCVGRAYEAARSMMASRKRERDGDGAA